MAALVLVRVWTSEVALTLHPAKTHVGDCRLSGQGFEFLGYRFEAGVRRVRQNCGGHREFPHLKVSYFLRM